MSTRRAELLWRRQTPTLATWSKRRIPDGTLAASHGIAALYAVLVEHPGMSVDVGVVNRRGKR